MSSGYETVDRIRRSWRNAKPNPAENPAWANTHMDVGILLTEIERLTAHVRASPSLSNAYVQLAETEIEAQRARADRLQWLITNGENHFGTLWRQASAADIDAIRHPQHSGDSHE